MVERESEGKNKDDDEPKIGGLSASKDGLSNHDLSKNSIVGVKLSNEKHVSRTDPDATIAGKKGEHKQLMYKTHHTADAESRVILDCHVTTGATSEVKTFQSRVEAVLDELKINPKEIVADRGYGSGYNLRYLERKKINSNIPLWSSNSGKSFLEELEAGFRIDPINKGAYCPEGHRMKVAFRENVYERTVYSMSRPFCKTCPKYETCLSEAEKKAGRGRR